jgi:hypothetical protein
MQGNMVIHISFPLFLYWRLLALNQAISRYILKLMLIQAYTYNH